MVSQLLSEAIAHSSTLAHVGEFQSPSVQVATPDSLYPLVQENAWVPPLAVSLPLPPEGEMWVVTKFAPQGLGSHVGEFQSPSVQVASPDAVKPPAQEKGWVPPLAVSLPLPPDGETWLVTKFAPQGLGSHVGEFQTPSVQVASPDAVKPPAQSNAWVPPLTVSLPLPSVGETWVVTKFAPQGLGSHVGESQAPVVQVASLDAVKPVAQLNACVAPLVVSLPVPSAGAMWAVWKFDAQGSDVW